MELMKHVSFILTYRHRMNCGAAVEEPFLTQDGLESNRDGFLSEFFF